MATFNEIYLNTGVPGVTSVAPIASNQGIMSTVPFIIPPETGGGDTTSTFSPTTSATGTNMSFQNLGGMALGGILSAINPVLGMAYSLSNPNSMTRQVLANIGFNPTTEGSINGPFGGYNGFDGTEGDFGSVATQAESEASMSEGMSDVGDSSGGVDSAGDGGDGYAYGGRVNYLHGGISTLLR